MVGPSLNLNVDVNKCFSGLWKSWRRPNTDVERLKKEMEKLKAKRNDIKSKIEEAKRGSNLATAEAKQWQRDLESLEDQVAAIFEDFTRITFHDNIKIGAWGGSGEQRFDIGGSAFQITRVRLHAGIVVDSLEVSYVDDRNKVATSRAGGSGGKFHEFELRAGEYINSMVGSVREYNGETCITQLEFRTNLGKQHGPFGAAGSNRFTVPVKDGRIVGFFGRYTKYVNKIGVYLAPN
ncbi:horcolin-like [Zingiber officinale]|uniref:Jacalin-type lectin domain-containing protein n=1 Tax=Zingiber officinale TaxID=94328 RepID=A0A8J5I835_ZINOF|nr:horcolin-like [Zingiber officinale]KAG6530541.1 hypothetical protein ZIOFF_012780 [Zingiber officinale]